MLMMTGWEECSTINKLIILKRENLFVSESHHTKTKNNFLNGLIKLSQKLTLWDHGSQEEMYLGFQDHASDQILMSKDQQLSEQNVEVLSLSYCSENCQSRDSTLDALLSTLLIDGSSSEVYTEECQLLVSLTWMSTEARSYSTIQTFTGSHVQLEFQLCHHNLLCTMLGIGDKSQFIICITPDATDTDIDLQDTSNGMVPWINQSFHSIMTTVLVSSTVHSKSTLTLIQNAVDQSILFKGQI